MLQADDLEVGLLVTVLEHKPIQMPTSLFGDVFGETKTKTFNNRGGMGSLSVVTSVMYPYVILRDIRVTPPLGHFRRTIDIRCTHLMKVTDEFALASLGTDWREQVERTTALGG